jgi:putative ABC transport system ATP-binding protein
MRALALLDPLDGGEVRWRRKPIARGDTAVPASRRAYPPAARALDGTVEDNRRYPHTLRAYRDVRFDRAHAAALASRAARADDVLDRRASELSGSEAQIAALVHVLQLAPDVLLLDEPTASLDPDVEVRRFLLAGFIAYVFDSFCHHTVLSDTSTA